MNVKEAVVVLNKVKDIFETEKRDLDHEKVKKFHQKKYRG
jgi:hypothetical protein